MDVPLERLLPALLGPLPWEERRALVDEYASALLTDAADGRLAVIALRYAHDGGFADRVGAIRNALELGRFDGFDGVERPLSHYFRPLFAEGGPEAEYVEPAAPPAIPGDQDVQLVTAVGMAFLQSRTWETRRRIAAAYPGIAHEGGRLEAFFEALAGQPEWQSLCQQLMEVLARARDHGLDAAFSQAPMDAFAGASVASDGALLTRDEHLQLAWLAYLQAPAWHRRREILRASADLLLQPGAGARLDGLWDEAASQIDATILGPARSVLDRARADGVDAAFAGELGPSHVMIASATWSLAAEGSSVRRLHDLRRLVHFFDPGILPRVWALACTQLADALIGTMAGQLRPEAVEEAVLRCVDALVVLGSEAGSSEWRRAQRTLGSAHLHRVRGDRAAWGDAAIGCFERSLRAAAQAGEISEAAHESVQLALAYLTRRSGIRVENLEIARQYAEQGLRAYQGDGGTKDTAWASAMVGQVYSQRLVGDRAENRAQAIRYLGVALAALDRDADTELWGNVNHTLGGIYAVAGPEHHRQAMEHLQAALSAFPREQWELRWAETQHALGTALMRAGPGHRAIPARAREHYRAALEVFEASAYPAERRRTLREVAATYFRERRWKEALDGLQQVIELGQWLEAGTRSDVGRLAEISDMVDVYERAAYCLVRLGRASEALPLLDAGKTRGLRHVLGVGDEQAGALSLAELREVFRGDGAVVVPVVTSQGSIVFLLTDRPGEPAGGEVLELPGLRVDDLRALLDGTPDRTGWLFAYRGWLESHEAVADPSGGDAAAAEAAEESALQVWADTIGFTCQRMWELLMGTVHSALMEAGIPPGATVRVLPSKWLYLLPLHAAWRRQDGTVRSFLDDYAVAYAPSGWMLAECRARVQGVEATRPRLLALIDPTGDLRHAPAEGEAVSAPFGEAALVLPGANATGAQLVASLPGRSHVHLACHGEFSWLDPTASGLQLAGNELLSARDVASLLRLEEVRLVVLSACETGITESDRLPNEYVGLAGSFLQAGAPTVVCSLWSVEDESTARLMGAFYERHVAGGAPPAAALRDAQLRLRADGDFAHPFYWAPFLVMGA